MRTVSIEYQYPIQYIEFRKQNSSGATGLDSMDLHFREVAAADFQTIAMLRNGNEDDLGFSHNRFIWADDAPMRRLVRFEGRNWLEWGSYEELEGSLLGRGGAARSPFEAERGSWYPNTKYSMMAAESAKHPRSREHYDGNQDTAATLEQTAARLVVAGEVVYEQVDEPMLVVKSWGKHAEIRIEGFRDGSGFDHDDLTRPDENRLPFHCRRARLDDLEGLRSRLVEAGYEVEAVCRVEGIDGTHLHALPGREVLLGSGDFYSMIARALKSIMPSLHEMEADQMAALIDLRDAYLAAGTTMTRDLVEAIEEVAGTRTVHPEEEYRSSFRRPEMMDLYARLQQWAREWLEAVRLDADCRDQEMIGRVHTQWQGGSSLQQVRSTKDLEEAARMLEIDTAALQDCIDAGGSVHVVRARVESAVSRRFKYRLADEEIVGCLGLDRHGAVAIREERFADGSYAQVVDFAAEILSTDGIVEDIGGMRP